jgi:hypothetical protein
MDGSRIGIERRFRKGGEGVHSTSKHALWRLAVSVTVVAAVAVAWAGSALAQTGQGTLEICKSSLNGMSGKTFEFSVNGGSTITIKGGRCTGPMLVTAGNVTIIEKPTVAPNPATDVAAVRVTPSSRSVSTDLPNRKAVVLVPADSTASNETRVTFINQPAGGNKGDLKICKLSETPAYWGRQFSFTVNGGPAISTEANPSFDDPSTWSCRLAGSFQVGSRVTVQELIPAGTEVAFIDTDPGDRLIDFDTNAGTALVQIGSGVTVVLYDDEPAAPQGNGYLEICKDRARLDHDGYDWDVQGEFEFTVTDAAGDEQDVTVLAGQCSAPLLVAAGVAHVQEHARPGYTLVNTFTIPEDRWLSENLINGTADVEVPVSDDPADETQLHFVNARERGQLKVCKALGSGSADLIGRTFTFSLTDVTDPENAKPIDLRYPLEITAGSSTQCKIVDYFPIGTVIQVDENPFFQYIRTTSSNNPVTIKAGINTVTFTNTALGKLEICKFVTDRLEGTEANHTFYFRIDGGSRIAVRAGRCSIPQLVSVGSHTVTEESDLNYELDPYAPGDGIKVSPPDAEKSRNLLARSVTVNVPWAGNPSQIGAEVRVDYYNRIRRAQLKVCKHVEAGSLDSLGDKEWTFYATSNYPNSPTVTLSGVRNEECRIVTHGGYPLQIPILLPNGTPTNVTVTEQSGAGWMVSAITVQGARGNINADTANSTVSFDLGPNTNTVHFTNKSTPDP